MHVLFLTTNAEFLKPEGGKERQFLQGLISASEALHIIVLTLRGSKNKITKISENAWVYPTNALPGFQIFGILRIARRQLFWKKELNAHVIHSDDTHVTGWAGLLLSVVYNRVWIVNIRAYEGGLEASARRFFSSLSAMPVRLALSYAYRVCIFSDVTRLYLLSTLQKNKDWKQKVILFPHIYDVDLFGGETGTVDVKKIYPEFNFVIIAIATLRQGSEMLAALSTLRLLRQNRSYSRAGMIIIGGGFAALIAYARAFLSGLSSAVRIKRSSSVPSSYIKTANMFLYLSKGRENEDMLIKAAAAHCPIIAVDDVLVREVIKDGINGKIVDQVNPQELANIIIAINQGATREIFKVNSAMNLKQVVEAPREEIIQALRALWEYEVAPEPVLAFEIPNLRTHKPMAPPRPPTKLERNWIEFKKTWKEMFPPRNSER